MVMINVGANKGYNVAEFVQRYGNGTGGGPATNKAWYTALKAGNHRVRVARRPLGAARRCTRPTGPRLCRHPVARGTAGVDGPFRGYNTDCRIPEQPRNQRTVMCSGEGRVDPERGDALRI